MQRNSFKALKLLLVSVPRVEHLHTGPAPHLVCERAQLLRAVATRRAESRGCSRPVLAANLHAKGRTLVVGLVTVKLANCRLRTRFLRHGPARRVSLVRRVASRLRHVTAGAYSTRGRNQVLDAHVTPAVAKRVLGCVTELRLVRNHVLGARVSVVMDTVEAGLCADLGCGAARSSVVVRLDRVIEEQSVLVEIVLRLFLLDPACDSKRELWCL